MSHVAEYFYEVTLKNGTTAMRRHTKIVKTPKKTKKEITEMRYLYNIGMPVDIIKKKFNVSGYKFRKIINLEIPPVHQKNPVKVIKRRFSM